MARSKLPTDLEILDAIYNRYYPTFSAKTETPKKAFVPIDIQSIADGLGVDPDIVFGRLYYHLNQKHGYVFKDGTKVTVFAQEVDGVKYCVHLPFLSSVLAPMREDHHRHRSGRQTAVAAFVVSIVSLLISLATLLLKLKTGA